MTSWLDRVRASANRSLTEARMAMARRSLERELQRERADSSGAGTAAEKPPATPASPRPAALDGPPALLGGALADGALAASWEDPQRRPWLLVGAACVFVILLLIASGLVLARPPRAAVAPSAPPGSNTSVPAAPGAQPPVEQPAQPAAPEAPGAAAAPAPVGTGEAKAPLAPMQMVLHGLPLLLGLFWLLSAWLVDAEARRAFVIQEPWGERRTVAYSILAVGCAFPLILAGLIFAAYGFVQFVLYVVSVRGPRAGIEAGGLIFLAAFAFLLVRSYVARWLSGQRERVFPR